MVENMVDFKKFVNSGYSYNNWNISPDVEVHKNLFSLGNNLSENHNIKIITQ